MAWQEIVYEGTWYLDPELDRRSLELIDPPKDGASWSPLKCEFGEMPLRAIPWDEPAPGRHTVRIMIWDDPEVFHEFSEPDRHFLLLLFANSLAGMLGMNHYRSQYGFLVRVNDGGPREKCFHAEYHMSLIKTEFPDPEQPPRHIARIWRGRPPRIIRKGQRKQSD